MPSVNLISPDNGFGNRKDTGIVLKVLSLFGVKANVIGVKSYGRKYRSAMVARYLLRHPWRADLNLFLGPIYREWFALARRNAIIPNPEWFSPDWIRHLSEFNLVLAKTRLTEQLFSGLGCRTTFVSFSSDDALHSEHPKSYSQFLHVSSGPWKGTDRLLKMWKSHPEWPRLTAIIHRQSPPKESCGNVEVITDYLDTRELRRLQNSTGVHICCSESEGFGHYITEAMSTRAVTITTDGAPMNELVRPDRGILIGFEQSSPRNLSSAYQFSVSAFEKAFEGLLLVSDADKARIGERARMWFVENDRFAKEQLLSAIESLVAH